MQQLFWSFQLENPEQLQMDLFDRLKGPVLFPGRSLFVKNKLFYLMLEANIVHKSLNWWRCDSMEILKNICFKAAIVLTMQQDAKRFQVKGSQRCPLPSHATRDSSSVT